MKKLNASELCSKYNSARLKNVGKKHSSQTAVRSLMEEGISKNSALKMLRSKTLFTQVKRENAGRGNYRGYMFSYNPVHISWFNNWLNPSKPVNSTVSSKSDEDFESECVEYLKEKGYVMRRCIGLDKEALKRDHPDIYNKYLIYKNI